MKNEDVVSNSRSPASKAGMLALLLAAATTWTPVVHGGHLFFVSDQGFATCLEAKTGRLI